MKKFNCAGTGLLALDVLIKGNSEYNPKIFAGGSCGNVLSILSFLGLNSYPIARLGDNDATDLIIEDLTKWNVNFDFIEREEKGSTPIIIHRILDSPLNQPKHRFEFRNPNNGKWLPSFRPVLAKKVDKICNDLPKLDLFYFDRISRSSIELAKFAKKQGALIFFEPSSNRDRKQFDECLEVSDIVKFSNDRIKSYKDEYPHIQTILEIETNGKEGLNYRFNSNEWKSLKAYEIDNALDTAGAGDWCSAGIIDKLFFLDLKTLSSLRETNIIDALKYGQALGAINCLYIGARGLMYQIDKQELKRIIEFVYKRKPINIEESQLESWNNNDKVFELDVILQSS